MQAFRHFNKKRGFEILALLAVLALVRAAEHWSKPEATVLPGGGLEGRVRLVDGDSFHMGSDEIRLEGIDAPEGRQMCTREGRSWACGEAARRELERLIAGRSITCDGIKRDQHGRMLAICRAGGNDLNAAMVASGMAVAFGSRYRHLEREAEAARRGLWAGEFERPQDWRHRNGIGL